MTLTTILSVFVGIIRLISKKYMDGTILYDRIIARWSFVIISIWLVAMLISLCVTKGIERIIDSGVWRMLDVASYPLFLTHYMFLTGPMKVMDWYNGRLMQIILFIIYTIVSAGLITVITDWKQVKECISDGES